MATQPSLYRGEERSFSLRRLGTTVFFSLLREGGGVYEIKGSAPEYDVEKKLYPYRAAPKGNILVLKSR